MSKSLIIYFSRADENYAVGYIDKGNTEIVAEYVQEMTGADLFKVEPLVPYAKDYNTCIKEAKQRIGNAPIKDNLSDISAYDTVFIMSPIYWGTYAPEMETALQGLDFTGKTVRVISTHEGSGLGSMVSDVKKMCKGADVQKNGLNFEDEIERSTDVVCAQEITKSKSLSDFKRAVSKMKAVEFRRTLTRHKLDLSKLWMKQPPSAFHFVTQDAERIKAAQKF